MLDITIAPISYLRIRHPQKWVVDWLMPSILTAISTVLVICFAKAGAIAGPSGLIDRLCLACSILPGFYIASLAAIATFNRPDIDELMPAPTPTLLVVVHEAKKVLDLTRRRFLAYLFGFLCWESLLLLVYFVFAGVIAQGVMQHLGAFAPLGRAAFIVIAFFLFWQLICATCLGLYYLADRLNRPAF
ncbi:hypothetical protein [Luteibacter aegosomatissinici]|uniref:hypothetical protein n=1 Tax=Luteibacter aegosomatissinici TaxID=2911539 RepID=UPI001FFABDD4|nr:hypothetical protein [Luteibacter aegosomatissinici]UPG92667.1 hypothetical protein L2Y97_12400 [Luteibacter aegosomatissinici]